MTANAPDDPGPPPTDLGDAPQFALCPDFRAVAEGPDVIAALAVLCDGSVRIAALDGTPMRAVLVALEYVVDDLRAALAAAEASSRP